MTEAGRPAVDPLPLGRFLAERAPELAGPFEVERLGEGQSCLTFLLRGDGWEVVLRRPPRGELPAGAFDVAREYRVMRALSDHEAPVPVPRPLVLCEDPAVLGAPFYLMERVLGVVVRDELPAGLSALGDRRRMGEELLRALVALHGVDHLKVGLEGFGRSLGYLDRQLLRMHGQWQAVRFRDVAEIDRVGQWLAERMPGGGGKAAIVHGDYKLDNVLFAAASPASILAVVDWEMSTVGDPLADLGWLLYFWPDPDDPPPALPIASVTHLRGFPRRAELLRRYADATGRDVEHARWYAALAGWKIAIIMEASYRRYLEGITDHAGFSRLEDGVPALARRAELAASGELGV